jgi:hypothetical protein
VTFRVWRRASCFAYWGGPEGRIGRLMLAVEVSLLSFWVGGGVTWTWGIGRDLGRSKDTVLFVRTEIAESMDGLVRSDGWMCRWSAVLPDTRTIDKHTLERHRPLPPSGLALVMSLHQHVGRSGRRYHRPRNFSFPLLMSSSSLARFLTSLRSAACLRNMEWARVEGSRCASCERLNSFRAKLTPVFRTVCRAGVF